MSYEKLKIAVKRLADADPDFAISKNQIGPMKAHAGMIHFCADRAIWKRSWAIKVYSMVAKYRNTQVPEFDQIPRPEAEADEWNQETDLFGWEDFHSLDWGKPKYIAKLGKNVYNLAVPEGWYPFYKAHKEEIKKLGVSMSEYQGNWTICKWESAEEQEELIKTPAVSVQMIKPKVSFDFSNTILYDYQREHAQKMAQSLLEHNVALDGSGTGTGKTPTNLSICKVMGIKPFIICPIRVVAGWYRNATEVCGMNWESDVLGIANYELIKMGKMLVPRINKKGNRVWDKVECPYIKIEANPNAHVKYQMKTIMTWKMPEKSVLIFDEAHKTKNRDTQNAQLLFSSAAQKVSTLLLSATVGESPLKMAAVAKALGFYNEPWDYYRWCEQHGCRKEVVNRRTGATAWSYYGGITEMKQLHHEIYGNGLGSLMDKEELIKQGKFPKTLIIAESYNFNGEQKEIQAVYDEMAEEIADIKAKESKISPQNKLALLQKAAQKAELIKVPMMVDWAKDEIDEGRSVVIFVNFTATLHAFEEKLDTHCTIYGENDKQTNEANRKAFEENQSRILICNMAAAAEGIDLHDKYHQYPRVTLMMPNYNPTVLSQVLGRVHRAGGTDSVQYLVYAQNTIEEKICAIVSRKIKNIEALNDSEIAHIIDSTDEQSIAELL